MKCYRCSCTELHVPTEYQSYTCTSEPSNAQVESQIDAEVVGNSNRKLTVDASKHATATSSTVLAFIVDPASHPASETQSQSPHRRLLMQCNRCNTLD